MTWVQARKWDYKETPAASYKKVLAAPDIQQQYLNDAGQWKSKFVRDQVLQELGFDKAFIQEQPFEKDLPGVGEPGRESYEEAWAKANSGEIDPTLFIADIYPTGRMIKEGGGVTKRLLDDVGVPENMKKIMRSWTPEEYNDFEHLLKWTDQNNISLSNAMIRGSTEEDVGYYLTHSNLFAMRDMFKGQDKLATDYIKMMKQSMDSLKAKGVDIKNIQGWEDVNQAGKIISEEVRRFRLSLKKEEAKRYGEVDTLVKGRNDEYRVDRFLLDTEAKLADESVPPEAVSAVTRIFDRFKRPYKANATKINSLTTKRNKLAAEIKVLNQGIKEAAKEEKTATVEQLMSKVSSKTASIRTINEEINSLKDIRYMTGSEILGTVKLLNRKIYKPGGAIDSKDADELRGLMIAKQELMGFFEKNAATPEIKKAVSHANKATIFRTGLFGPKDTGGEKYFLASLLESNEYAKAQKLLAGESGLENLMYVRNTLGKDSVAYKTGFKFYMQNKLGLTMDQINSIKDSSKVFDTTSRVKFEEIAKGLRSISPQDENLIKQTLGSETLRDIKSMKRLVAHYEDIERFADKYGRGITSGKMPYILKGEGMTGPVGRGLKIIKDATTYYAAKQGSKMIRNHPAFRTVTGSITGETMYLTQTDQEDLSWEGAVMSAIVGGGAGFYVGKAMRNVFEQDIAKIRRYIEAGDFKKEAPHIKGALSRIGKLAEMKRQVEPEDFVPGFGVKAADFINANVPKLKIGSTAAGAVLLNESEIMDDFSKHLEQQGIVQPAQQSKQ